MPAHRKFGHLTSKENYRLQDEKFDVFICEGCATRYWLIILVHFVHVSDSVVTSVFSLFDIIKSVIKCNEHVRADRSFETHISTAGFTG